MTSSSTKAGFCQVSCATSSCAAFGTSLSLPPQGSACFVGSAGVKQYESLAPDQVLCLSWGCHNNPPQATEIYHLTALSLLEALGRVIPVSVPVLALTVLGDPCRHISSLCLEPHEGFSYTSPLSFPLEQAHPKVLNLTPSERPRFETWLRSESVLGEATVQPRPSPEPG
jgi:hypothetical protein